MKTQLTTIEQWLKDPTPTLWCDIRSLVPHILKEDTNLSLHKTPIYKKYGSGDNTYIRIVRDAMENHQIPTSYRKTILNSWNPQRKRKERKSDDGDFCLDRYLDGDPEPFTETVKFYSPKPAVNIVFDCAVRSYDVTKTYMEERHKRAFALANECESMRVPCRILAAWRSQYLSREYPSTITWFFVIKDYDGPIYPGIWGVLATNKSTNAFTNCVSNYVVGTARPANAYLPTWNVSPYIKKDERIVLASDPENTRVYCEGRNYDLL